MWPVHGGDVSTLWKSGCLNFLDPSGSIQGVLYLLSHISGYKLMKHPTFQLSGFSCIVLADRAVTIFAVKKTEGDYSAWQNTWNNTSTWHCWTPKAVLKRRYTQDQNLRISSPKLHFFLRHSAIEVLRSINLHIKLFTALHNFRVSRRLWHLHEPGMQWKPTQIL
jgi:hypothetical protein